MQTFKKMKFHQSIHVFLTHRSYLSVTEKSNTYDVSFPQASISKNKSVSLNQRKGLLPWQQAKNLILKNITKMLLVLTMFIQRADNLTKLIGTRIILTFTNWEHKVQ